MITRPACSYKEPVKYVCVTATVSQKCGFIISDIVIAIRNRHISFASCFELVMLFYISKALTCFVSKERLRGFAIRIIKTAAIIMAAPI
jgi:hypothetical protein